MHEIIILFEVYPQLFLGGMASRLPPAEEALLLACGYLALCWLLLLFLCRKKVFLKV